MIFLKKALINIGKSTVRGFCLCEWAIQELKLNQNIWVYTRETLAILCSASNPDMAILLLYWCTLWFWNEKMNMFSFYNGYFYAWIDKMPFLQGTAWTEIYISHMRTSHLKRWLSVQLYLGINALCYQPYNQIKCHSLQSHIKIILWCNTLGECFRHW